MEQYNSRDWTRPEAPSLKAGSMANAFLQRVFLIMAMGLAITGLMAWFVADRAMTNYDFAYTLYASPLRWLFFLAPLIFPLIFYATFNRMSYRTATIMFIAFALVMGVSLSAIFLVYTSASIFQTFLITAGTYGVFALIGATTKIDLTKMGSILYMAFIGIMIMSLVNWFMQSEAIYYLIGGIGVVVFSGLTAYYVQTLLRIGQQVQEGENANKMAIMGALMLYINFINLFLMLLRFFGSRE